MAVKKILVGNVIGPRGKSAYEEWLEQSGNAGKTFDDFLNYLSMSVPNADWEQNDEHGIGYIKNKPFYEYEVNEVIFDGDIAIPTHNGADYYYFPRPLNIIDGNEYLIQFDDINPFRIVAGDGFSLPGGELTQQIASNVKLYNDRLFFWYYVKREYHVKISSIDTRTVLKQLDEKFISYKPGMKVENGGEIFNDYINNIANAPESHAEGRMTKAVTRQAHAEGDCTVAGDLNIDTSDASPIEDYPTGSAAHAEGIYSNAKGTAAHAEGYQGKAIGNASHAEGKWTNATNEASHAEGNSTTASGIGAHAEGERTRAEGAYSHAEGGGCWAYRDYTHAEGCNDGDQPTIASCKGAHAEGMGTISSGYGSHSEGKGSQALREASHAEGRYTKVEGDCGHAEGEYSKVTDGALCGHAEGYNTTAGGKYSHAEGQESIANGNASHVEGYKNTTGIDAACAHAEGDENQANGYASHVEGKKNIANGEYQHVQGKYNVADNENKYAHIVGGGTSDTNRKNIHTIDWNGNAEFAGDVIARGCNGEEPVSLLNLAQSIPNNVREQISKLSSEIDNILSNFDIIKETKLNLNWLDYSITRDGNFGSNMEYKHAVIDISIGDRYIISAYDYMAYPAYYFIDSNGNVTSYPSEAGSEKTYHKDTLIEFNENGVLYINKIILTNEETECYKAHIKPIIYEKSVGLPMLTDDIANIFVNEYEAIKPIYNDYSITRMGTLGTGDTHKHAEIQVKAGEKYIISGYDYSAYPLYLIKDVNGNVVEYFPKDAGTEKTYYENIVATIKSEGTLYLNAVALVAMPNVKKDLGLNLQKFLYSKTIYNDGDSVARGAGNDLLHELSYAEQIAVKYSMILTQKAVSGTTLAVREGRNDSICERMLRNLTGNTYDYILFEGGFNDVAQNVPVGVISTDYNGIYNSTTIIGALETICYTLVNNHSDSKILFILGHKYFINLSTQEEVWDSLISVLEKWGIPYVDMRKECYLVGANAELKEKWFYNSDGLHPNTNAYKHFYVNKVTSKLISL